MVLKVGAGEVLIGVDTGRPNWFTTNDLICRGVTGALVEAVVGLAVVGLAVVGLAVVGLAVVGLAVVGLAVVGLAVVGLGVVGLGVVGRVTDCAGRTTELALLAPLDLEASTEGFSVRISTNFMSLGFSSGRAFFFGWCNFLVGRKKVSENLSAVRALPCLVTVTGSLTGAGLIAPNL